ncbi:MAG TPA: trehalose-6-phosphate synthase [Dehalococcoidia bacterium]|nr:trehalose-6-phosphate synthase [Dehalococcoidia bacterium]
MIEAAGRGGSLLTVSNRGPLEYRWSGEGEVVAVPGQGGLATALSVAARLHPTIWLSSPLSDVDRLVAEGRVEPPARDGAAHFVLTEPEAYELFYGRFSNEVLWFLQHSLPWPPDLDESERERAWRSGYQQVNKAFADAVVSEIDTGAVRAVMFHDYHFYTAPAMVRRARPHAYLQHFIHIPWPPASEWKRLDPAIVQSLCLGLLGNDSVVFQTPESARNFVQTCAAFAPACDVDADRGVVRTGGRKVRVWADPISVDPEELAALAASPEFSRYRYLLRPQPGVKTILRVDRLDLTKNIVRGFEAYRLLLREHPELREQVYFLALLVPSRSDIESYREYQDEALTLVESINREFGNLRWKPIRVIFENNRIQALAAMSLYDVLVVNPVADGMNLVAKEGPTVNTRDGVLVLSRTAGAFEELGTAALGVNPYDVAETAEAIYRALTMPPEERRDRFQRLRSAILNHDLRDWFAALLDDIDRHAPVPASTAA